MISPSIAAAAGLLELEQERLSQSKKLRDMDRVCDELQTQMIALRVKVANLERWLAVKNKALDEAIDAADWACDQTSGLHLRKIEHELKEARLIGEKQKGSNNE